MSDIRRVAWVGRAPDPPRTRHTIRNGNGSDELMPAAQVLVLEAKSDGSAQVYRYALDGEFAGDTWHETMRDAEEQLAFEYGDALGPWQDVPGNVSDAHDYALTWARTFRP